jgi:hypothetical protein
MPGPGRPTFALVAALLALAMQWCVPLAHAAHQASVQPAHHDATNESHHHHDHREHSGDGRHDESQCPTCQHLLALRAFAPTIAPVTLARTRASSAAPAPLYNEPFVSPLAHAPAVPRGPPVG